MLRFLARRWFLLSLGGGIALALTAPRAIQGLLAPVAVKYVAGSVLFLISIGLSTRRLREVILCPWAALVALIVSYVAAPPLSWLAADVFLPEDYQIGLVVAGCVPCTLASAAIWTKLAGGNEAVSILVTMISNSTVFIFTAGWLARLTGQHVAFHVVHMMQDLCVYVVAPIVIGQLLRVSAALRGAVDQSQGVLGIACRVLILLIVVKSAVNASRELDHARTPTSAAQLVIVAVVCVGVHITLLGVGHIFGSWLFDRRDAIAIAFAGSQKTLPVGALLIDEYYKSFPLSIVPMLFFHVGQLIVDTYIADRYFYRQQQPLGTPTEEPTTASDV